jgi:hypothetical protein
MQTAFWQQFLTIKPTFRKTKSGELSMDNSPLLLALFILQTTYIS